MITFDGFIFGAILMALGFLMVARTDWFINMLGDPSDILGFVGLPWMSWKILGLAFIVFGFFIAFGLFGLIIQITLGRLVPSF